MTGSLCLFPSPARIGPEKQIPGRHVPSRFHRLWCRYLRRASSPNTDLKPSGKRRTRQTIAMLGLGRLAGDGWVREPFDRSARSFQILGPASFAWLYCLCTRDLVTRMKQDQNSGL